MKTLTGRCPRCSAPLSGELLTHVGLPDVAPRAGDISVCLYCTAFLTFTNDLTRRELTTSDFIGLDAETRAELINARVRILLYAAQFPQWGRRAHMTGVDRNLAHV